MARAKNIQRADARRRHRDQVRVNQLSAGELDSNVLSDSGTAPRVAPQPQPARTGMGGMFQRPQVREDLLALPDLFRTRRLIWVPFILLVVAFFLQLVGNNTKLPDPILTIAAVFVSLTLPPTALFVPFIGGFLAPRASYLIGGLIGLLDGILYGILTLVTPPGNDANGQPLPPATLGSVIAILLVAILVSAFAAAFAAWYRNFLRTSQERARQNRVAKEEQQREKKREDERKQRMADREARRTAASGKTTP